MSSEEKAAKKEAPTVGKETQPGMETAKSGSNAAVPLSTATNKRPAPDDSSKSPEITAGNSSKKPAGPTKKSRLSETKMKVQDDDDAKDDDRKVLDVAEHFGYKPGDRLQVRWHIEQEDGTESTQHWWNAKLLEYTDGRTAISDEPDGDSDLHKTHAIAIRVLEYEARPDLGFAESSKEDVLFVGRNTLLNVSDQGELKFRREGDTNEYNNDDDEDEQNGAADAIDVTNRDDLESVLNMSMVSVMQNSQAWKSMDRAKQAAVVDMIQAGKERLMTLLENHPGGVVTADDMRKYMAQVAAGSGGGK